MTRTAYYISKFQGEPSALKRDKTSNNDSLLRPIGTQNMNSIENAAHQSVLKWLKECSATTPELSDEVDDSIVSWFIQSAYLLPIILKLTNSNSEQPKSNISETIKILIQNKCLSSETIGSLKQNINDIPAPQIVWQILDDVHQYALDKMNVSVPLTKATGKDLPVIFNTNTINKFLTKLKLPHLPSIDNQKPIVDDPFKNGQFLMDFYVALTKDRQQTKFKPTASIKSAKHNVEKAIDLLIKNNFLDDSFSSCSIHIVNGDMLTTQQIISLVMWNSSASNSSKPKPLVTQTNPKEQQQQQEDETGKVPIRGPNKTEPVFVKDNKIQDGISLVKLLTCIDSDFSQVECLFAKPENEVEKKWNIRKSLEFLGKKANWPSDKKIDPSLLYSGELYSVQNLFKGITTCYHNKFISLSAIMNLKEILGLDTDKI